MNAMKTFFITTLVLWTDFSMSSPVDNQEENLNDFTIEGGTSELKQRQLKTKSTKEHKTGKKTKGPKNEYKTVKEKKTKSKKSKSEDSVNPLWPEYLVSQAQLYRKRPTNTTEAGELNWVKSDELCTPSLGEAWLYKGDRGIKSSVTLYFTPEISDDVPGTLSGIEVDYYGYIEKNLIGSYFSEERTSKDGTYHSVAVALRNSATEDLCSASSKAIKKYSREKYIAISPDMANEQIPMEESSLSKTDNWHAGSCIHGMGYHWLQDVIGGKNLTYKAENTVPVVIMYDDNGSFVGIFFLATEKKQNWPDTCSTTAPTQPCIENLNFWDPGGGLLEANEGRYYMCGNLCGKCQFTGSGDGVYTTMHWFFTDPLTQNCVGDDKDFGSYCPSGSYPKDFVY